MKRKLIHYLPEMLRDFAELQALMTSQQLEFEQLWDAIDVLLEDQFVQTAGAVGLARWEKILGMIPKGTDTLETRRFRILAQLNERLPYTLPNFRNMLDNLCGPGNTKVEVSEERNILRISIGETVWTKLSEIKALTERITPANLYLLYNLQLIPVTAENKNQMGLIRLLIRSKFNNWFQSPVLFHGAVKYDGEIQWDQRIFARLFSLLRIQAGVQTDSSNSFTLLFPFRFAERNTSIFLFCTRSDFWNGASVRFGPLTIRSQAKTKGAVSARIITNKDFKFNGIAAWNGAKKFNSGAVIDL